MAKEKESTKSQKETAQGETSGTEARGQVSEGDEYDAPQIPRVGHDVYGPSQKAFQPFTQRMNTCILVCDTDNLKGAFCQ